MRSLDFDVREWEKMIECKHGNLLEMGTLFLLFKSMVPLNHMVISSIKMTHCTNSTVDN